MSTAKITNKQIYKKLNAARLAVEHTDKEVLIAELNDAVMSYGNHINAEVLRQLQDYFTRNSSSIENATKTKSAIYHIARDIKKICSGFVY